MELRFDDLSYTEYKQTGTYDIASLLGKKAFFTSLRSLEDKVLRGVRREKEGKERGEEKRSRES